MSERSNQLLVSDILNSAYKIKRYTENLDYYTFLDDDKTKDAVIRNFSVIGEAANRMSDTFRNSYQNIQWNRIRGLRNRIVHEYFGIDYDIVWDIIRDYLPVLILELENITE